MRRTAAVVLAALLLAGCATGGSPTEGASPFNDLRQFVRADVTQALVMASKATDPGAPYRARCFATMLTFIPEPGPAPTGPDIKGVVSGLEAAIELKAKVSAGGLRVPEALQADCDYLKDELLRFALKSGMKLAPVPGIGALGELLGR